MDSRHETVQALRYYLSGDLLSGDLGGRSLSFGGSDRLGETEDQRECTEATALSFYHESACSGGEGTFAPPQNRQLARAPLSVK